MPTLFRDDVLDRLERSRAYLICDRIFNWVGGIGGFLLLAYVVRVWSGRVDVTGFFWLKVLLLGIALFLIKPIKNVILAWAGIAPPDHSRRPDAILPEMRNIIGAQDRAERIQERGVRVDELLEENHAKFLRLTPCLTARTAPESGRAQPLNWVKWILVLPAAVGAYAGVQIAVIIMGLTADSPTRLTQLAGAVMCPTFFVLAGAKTAPAYRQITSTCLTILVAIYSTAVVTWAIIDKLQTRWELIWAIICGVTGIVGGICACHAFRGEQQ